MTDSDVTLRVSAMSTSVTNALILTDQVMTWLENGVTNVDWWAIHNSPFDGNADPALYGKYEFGDYGLLSRGLTSDNGAVEPAAEMPFPAYCGLQMLSHLGHEAHSQTLGASSSTPLVAIHAVKQGDGKVHVLLINKNPSAAYTVSVSLNGASVRGIARVFSYGKDNATIQTSSKSVRGTSFAIKLAPYSMTTVQLP